MAKKKQDLTPEERLVAALVPEEEWPYELPEGWKWVYGKGFLQPMDTKLPTGKFFRYIDIESIDNSTQRVRCPKKLLVEKAPSRASRKLHPGDTIFSMVRPYLKNIAYITEEWSDCIGSTGFYVCSPTALIDGHYLYWLMVSPYVVNGLNRYMKGDNSPSIRKGNIETFIYPIPPLAEQHRLVARIESLFAKLNAAREKVQTVLDSREARKAALLHEAFTGKLTAKWREEQGICLESWYTDSLKNLCKKITDGTHHSPPNAINGDYMYITAKNIKETGISLDNITYVSATVHKEIYSRCDVQKGDVLYIKDGATTGIATVNTLDEPFSLLSSVAVLRPHKQLLLPSYLKHLLNSSEQKSKMISNMSGNAITRLTLSKIKATSIKVCSLPEQQEIVRILDRLLDKEQRAQQAAEATLAAIDRMKQSILARAFRGEL